MNLKDIIYLSQEDYAVLESGGTLIKDGVSYTYDDGNVYAVEMNVVPEAPSDGKQYVRKDGAWYEINIGGTVRYDTAQTIDEESKTRARNNIGAMPVTTFKTINAQSIVGIGNISIKTLAPMKDEWMSYTLSAAEAAELMLSDGVQPGEGYLGTVAWRDLEPLEMGCAEVKAFVISDGIIQFEMTSADTAPYAWFFNSAGGEWRTYIPINDTIESESMKEALSAKQGKVLAEMIGNVPVVVGNDSAATTAKLKKLKIGNVNYDLQGGGTNVYADYEAMISDINVRPAKDLEVGWNLYIRTTDVPDLWISKNDETTSSRYTYTTDEQFIEDLKAAASTGLQIGYYRVNELEAEKVHVPVEDVRINGVSNVVDGISNTELHAITAAEIDTLWEAIS